MAVRNGEPYLRESLKSLLTQTLSDFELVIVDDGSTDETPAILRAFSQQDSRIVILRNEQNLRLAASLNRGLRFCRAPLVARADADDVYMPKRLERQVAFMDLQPVVGVLGAACYEMDAEGKNLRISRHPSEDRQIRFELPFLCRLAHPSVMFRKDLVLAVGSYDEKYWTAQDYDLWSRLMPVTAFANLPEPLWYYRTHPKSTMSTRGDDGICLSRSISQRLLSAYLGGELGSEDVKAATLLYCSWERLPRALVGPAIAVLREYVHRASLRETDVTLREFKKHLATSFIRQSNYQSEKARLASFQLLIGAIALAPAQLFSSVTAKQIVRLGLPRRIYAALKGSREGRIPAFALCATI